MVGHQDTRTWLSPEEDITNGGANMPYIAPSWLWGELASVDAGRCSLVEYRYDPTCCFPIRSLGQLSEGDLEQAIRHGKIIGCFERTNQATKSFSVARNILLGECGGLTKDGEIRISGSSQDQECTPISTIIHHAGSYVSTASRLIRLIDSSAVSLKKAEMLAYESVKEEIDKSGRLMNIPIGIIVPLRNSLEHTPEFVSPINYRPDDGTFGLAINLESGLGDQIMKDRNGKKGNKNIKPILADIRDFLDQRRSDGRTPLISFADFQIWTDMYVSIYLMKFAEIARELYEKRTDWESNLNYGTREQRGVLWKIGHPEKGHETYMSDRLYPLARPSLLRLFSGDLHALAEKVFSESMDRYEKRTGRIVPKAAGIETHGNE